VTALSLEITDELVEQIATRAAELVAGNGQIEDGWLRGAQKIADYVDAPTSRVYALATTNPPRIPIERDGSALIARRSDLDRWIRSGGGTRT